MFPIIEAVHLVALAFIGGAILIVDLRLLGVGLRDQPLERLERDLRPWMASSLIVMIVTGVLLFSSEAVKCYYSFAFWVKMASLTLAILFWYTVHRKTAMSAESAVQSFRARLVGLVSLVLWAGVAWGGRWIGFS
jgi:hypothetical protein